MLSRGAPYLRMHDHQREPYAKCGPFAFALAGRVNGAAMHFDDVTDDRQPEPQTTCLARRSGVRLTESLEDVREELRSNTDPRIADGDLHVRVDAFETKLDPPEFRCELDGVGDEVPDDLLQTVRIARDVADARVDQGLHAYALRISCGLNRGDGVVDDDGQLHGLNVEANLARDNARDVEHVLDDLRQPGRIAFQGFQTARRFVSRQQSAAEQSRIAEDGVQRRAQFV